MKKAIVSKREFRASVKLITLTLLFLLILHIFSTKFQASAQSTIEAELSAMAGQMIRLVGFEGFGTYQISQAVADKRGRFVLTYSEKDIGMGYLESEDRQPFFVVLSGENIKIKGEHFSILESLQYEEGTENILFAQYASEHPKRNQALRAWNFLEKIYESDTLFSDAVKARQMIQKEIERLNHEDSAFLANLDKESYVSWFLPTRKLVSSVSYIAQYKTEDVPSAIEAFRNLDHTDQRFYKSGLFKDAIEAHYWLIENMGQPLDTVFKEMNISTDHLIDNLISDEKKFNMVTDFLFDLMERRSLFKSSEYLALKILNETSCTVDDDLAKQLETYRAMKIGNTATDIIFTGDTYKSGKKFTDAKKLSELDSDHYLIVFGATWCPKCTQEIPEIARHYNKWKSKGVEVIFISLDVEKEKFLDFSKKLPFISTCDYKRWKGKTVKEYHVFATPLMYLLGSKREILLRPNTVNQVDAWVDWYL